MRSCRVLALLSFVALLGACGGIPPRQDPATVRARYASYAGEPVDRITWMGRFDSWEALGGNQLLIFTTPNDAYLLSVTPPCTDLPFVQHIALTSTGNTVSVRLDSVIVNKWPCPIAGIRKVDYTRMRADMKQEAQQAKAKPAG